DPKNMAKNFVVVASHGIGEGVVQEKVPCDHFFINPHNKQISAKIVNKNEKLTFNHEAGYGIKMVNVSNTLQLTPTLSDNELWKLSSIGKEIEEIFKTPQDIEGCLDKDNNIYILQSRPIQIDFKGLTVWTNANVTESFPGVTTPLTYSFSRMFYRVIFHHCYRMLGVSNKTILKNFDYLDRMIGYLGGRIYYCLNSFYNLHSQSPLFPLFKKNWEEMMGFTDSFHAKESAIYEKIADKTKQLAYIFYGSLIIIYRYLTHERDLKKLFFMVGIPAGQIQKQRF
ncbi:MAG: hypothetical protein HQK51_20450, partial [Oligoflexia bacterium]|nr:hypothetical protein [Oligoflexia bacterium]